MLPLDVIGLGGNPNSDGFDGDKLLGRIAKGDQEASFCFLSVSLYCSINSSF